MARFEATPEQRELVAELAGYGASLADIADAIGVGVRTITVHFPTELRRKLSIRVVPIADDPTHPHHKQAAVIRERCVNRPALRRRKSIRFGGTAVRR